MSSLILISISFLPISAHRGGQSTDDLLDNADDHCKNPTLEITIAAIGVGKFDREMIEVPVDTCITIWFYNAVNIPHNFVIEHIHEPNFNAVYMQLENSSAVCGQASSDLANTPGKARFNILTPKFSTMLVYYCSYHGYQASGMHGFLKVGEGHDGKNKSTSNNFTLILLFLVVIMGFFIVKDLRKITTN